jgi:hypothetical protein
MRYLFCRDSTNDSTTFPQQLRLLQVPSSYVSAVQTASAIDASFIVAKLVEGSGCLVIARGKKKYAASCH